MKRLTALIFLASCTTIERPMPPTLEDTCGSSDYSSLVGQDATSLERVLILDLVRVIRPGDFVTQDFRPERINFMIGNDNTIEAIECG